jgi:outer membrane protein OmpA-like peptidoglycan-associated protein
MTGAGRAVPSLAVATMLWVTACGSPPPVVQPELPRDLVVLTTHPEDGALGAATVTTPEGSVLLSRASEAVQVRLGAAPQAPAILPADEIQRIFGDALAALPPPARRYRLYFESGSDTLTPDARALVPEILALVQSRTRPDVSIVGHTDSTDTAAANIALGLRRAGLVRNLLIAAGLESDLVEVASHGEANPVVPTADDVAEARNRRVEVTVR